VNIFKKRLLTILQASDLKLLNYFTVVIFSILLINGAIPKVFATPSNDLSHAIKSLNKISPEVDTNCRNLKEKKLKKRSKHNNNLFVIARIGLPGYESTVFKKINRSRVDFHTISKHYIRNESDERISFLDLSKDKMDIIFDLYEFIIFFVIIVL